MTALAPISAFAADVSEYGLWIGHIPVTSANKDDVLGSEDGDGATVAYDPDTRTLTLNNATITTASTVDNGHYNGIFAKFLGAGETLTIRLIGVNSVTSPNVSGYRNSVGICLSGMNLIIEGDGSLTAVGGSTGTGASYGIYGPKISICSGTVTAISGSGTNPSSVAISCSELDISGGTLTAVSGNAAIESFAIRSYLTTRISSGTVTAISGTASTAGAFNSAPVYSDYSPKVTAGSDESTAAVVGSPVSGTYTQNKYVSIEPMNAEKPAPPRIIAVTAGNGQATVSFVPPASNGGAAITHYTVTSDPGNLTATGTGSPITVSGLTNGIPYTFTVTATNCIGTGEPSAASNSVTPKAEQTIAFSEPAIEKTYGDSPFIMTADLIEGDGAVTYASDNTEVVTVDVTTGEVVIMGVGTAIITATASETGTYNAAVATCTIMIVKGTPTAADLDFDLTAVTYDGTAKSVNVTRKTEEIGEITVKYNGSTTTPVNAGTYTVTVMNRFAWIYL